MKTLRRLSRGLLPVAGLLLLLQPASAQRGERASLLVFPIYDSSSEALNVVSVTNTARWPGGGVWTRWVYTDGQSCSRFERLEYLAPSDTLSVLSRVHIPSAGEGYLTVAAVDGAGEPLYHNFLIGTSILSNGAGSLECTLEPCAFRAFDPGSTPSDFGEYPLNGVDYEALPEEWLFPRYVAQNDTYDSWLVVVDMTGGPGFSTAVRVTGHDHHDELFEAATSFSCWGRIPLRSIDDAFRSTLVEWSQQADFQTGWFRLRGIFSFDGATTIAEPAVLPVLVETTSADRMVTVHPAFVGANTFGKGVPFGS